MGEAKRRKRLDPTFGKSKSIQQTAMTKNVLDAAVVEGSSVKSIHLMVSSDPKHFNRGFCQIKTHKQLMTFWADRPFRKSGSLDRSDREWSGVFTKQIVDGITTKCNRKFSMQSLSLPEKDGYEIFKKHDLVDIFYIEDLLLTYTGKDLEPVRISIQIPSDDLNSGNNMDTENALNKSAVKHEVSKIVPNYDNLAELYLSQGLAPLHHSVMLWFNKHEIQPTISQINQVLMTVLDISSKNSKMMSSNDPKSAVFTLKSPFDPTDYSSYIPVQRNLEMSRESMSLINTGYFNEPINTLINQNQDAVRTLRKNVVVLYMGMNSLMEIFDVACALITLQPCKVESYLGESRESLDNLIENTFRPLSQEINNFRVQRKRADKFPCLSLLCLVENKVNGQICEFRRHFTAQSGNQLVIPGFSDGSQGTDIVRIPMDLLGKPRNIPIIRGFNN